MADSLIGQSVLVSAGLLAPGKVPCSHLCTSASKNAGSVHCMLESMGSRKRVVEPERGLLILSTTTLRYHSDGD